MISATFPSPLPIKGWQILLVIALEHLLQLPDSRFSVSEVLDLLDVPHCVRALVSGKTNYQH